ncbi:MAG: peroxiredoxin [Armatimonadota bacterium]|nr:peroxiredoxin [Armatimonadota bacterium]MDR7564046.1 peroxiredoxin [Armatimonadota bacterium]MDR7568443.1 peroxiredoxin [Armatimonadota bacterium]MDR7601715.1 peroxiredoxin [Armatimonadota bacterium]
MAEVRVGDQVPDVTLVSWDLQAVRLSSLLGQPLVLAFFPAAFTPICTREMCTFRDRLSAFEAPGARVVGISVDGPFALKAFAEQQGLNFLLLSDFNRETVRAFGIEDNGLMGGLLRGVAKRAVFVVDANGVVVYRWVSNDPRVEPDYEAVQQAVEGLRTMNLSG